MRLTPREHEIITLVADGYEDKEISAILKISAGTIRTHMKSLFLKLEARNRSHAAAMYIKIKYSKKKKYEKNYHTLDSWNALS